MDLVDLADNRSNPWFKDPRSKISRRILLEILDLGSWTPGFDRLSTKSIKSIKPCGPNLGRQDLIGYLLNLLNLSISGAQILDHRI